MRTKRGVPIKIKPRFAIVVDGETEFWYLQMLKRNERDISVDIRPEIPQKKRLSEQYAKVIALSKDYDMVYWIIDLDVVLNESLVTPRGQKSPLEAFLEYKKQIEIKRKNIVVIINHPCLEFWFLIHFEQNAQLFSNCGEAEKRLEKYIGDYSKTEKFFTRQNKDIYLQLKPRLFDALRNAQADSFDKENPYKGITEMHKLFQDLKVLRG